MASQKYWQDDHTQSLEDDDDSMFTQEEAEAMFKYECKEWIKNNQEKLLESPFAKAYKKPWTKKTSSFNLDGGKKKGE